LLVRRHQGYFQIVAEQGGNGLRHCPEATEDQELAGVFSSSFPVTA
jgi:hypothetical protein